MFVYKRYILLIIFTYFLFLFLQL